MDGHNYITDDDVLRDVPNLTSVLDPLLGSTTDHNTAGGLLKNPKVVKLLDRICDITRRDMLQERGPGQPSEGVPSEGVSLDGAMPGGAPLEKVLLGHPVSPEAAPFEAPPAGALPLQQRSHSCLDVTTDFTRWGAAAARSLLGRNVSNRSSSAYPTAIVTDGSLSEPQGLRLYSTAALPDIAHETYGAEFTVEYAYAATNVQSRSVGEK